MEILRSRHRTRRVHCNLAYQQYIKDKHHCRMNSTRWSTLTDFIQWLGREGLVKVEPTSKGLFVTYIDRSPETLAREAALAKKTKMERDDAERSQKMVGDQITKALAVKKEKGDEEEVVYSKLQRIEKREKVIFSLSGQQASSPSLPTKVKEEETRHEQPEAVPLLASAASGFSRTKKSFSSIASVINPLMEADRKARKKKVEGKSSQRLIQAAGNGSLEHFRKF